MAAARIGRVVSGRRPANIAQLNTRRAEDGRKSRARLRRVAFVMPEQSAEQARAVNPPDFGVDGRGADGRR